jgi:hypothetical protein
LASGQVSEVERSVPELSGVLPNPVPVDVDPNPGDVDPGLVPVIIDKRPDPDPRRHVDPGNHDLIAKPVIVVPIPEPEPAPPPRLRPPFPFVVSVPIPPRGNAVGILSAGWGESHREKQRAEADRSIHETLGVVAGATKARMFDARTRETVAQ